MLKFLGEPNLFCMSVVIMRLRLRGCTHTEDLGQEVV